MVCTGRLGQGSCAAPAVANSARIRAGVRFIRGGPFAYYGSMSASRLGLTDPQAQRFEINRAALVDPAIFAAEKERIFERCWLYVGHESEVRAPGDFCTRSVCGGPVILCRDSENALRVFLNT